MPPLSVSVLPGGMAAAKKGGVQRLPFPLPKLQYELNSRETFSRSCAHELLRALGKKGLYRI